MTLSVTNTWPVDLLPLPGYTFSGEPGNNTLVSPAESAISTRRERSTHNYPALKVYWTLTNTQYQIFRNFVANDLGNGTSQFSIELRYPDSATLAFWIVRFIADFDADYDNASQFWTVQAQLELFSPVEI